MSADHKSIIYDQPTIITVLYSSILNHHNTHYRFKPLWVEQNVLYIQYILLYETYRLIFEHCGSVFGRLQGGGGAAALII